MNLLEAFGLVQRYSLYCWLAYVGSLVAFTLAYFLARNIRDSNRVICESIAIRRCAVPLLKVAAAIEGAVGAWAGSGVVPSLSVPTTDSTASLASISAAAPFDSSRMGFLMGVPLVHSRDVHEEQRSFIQQGYKYTGDGNALWKGWLGMCYFTQVHLAWITIDRYFVRISSFIQWDFIFVYVLAHSALTILASGLSHKFFMLPCSLEEADEVLISEDVPSSQVAEESRFRLFRWLAKTKNASFVNVLGGTEAPRYFDYSCVRYLWSTSAKRFRPVGTFTASGASAHALLHNGGGSLQTLLELHKSIGPNAFDVEVHGAFATILEEFFDVVYIYQFGCIWIYLVHVSWRIACFWLAYVVGSGVYKSLSLVRTNHLQLRDYAQIDARRLELVLREGSWLRVEAWKLVPGDILQVLCGPATADIAIVSGIVTVDESMLTGDPLNIHKTALASNAMYDVDIGQGSPHVVFAGTQVLRSSGKGARTDTDIAVGIVVGIGACTWKGTMMRGLNFPSVRDCKHHHDTRRVFLVGLGYAAVGWLLVSVFYHTSLLSATLRGFCILIQTLNPMMPVSFSLGQCASAVRLGQAGCLCSSIGRIPFAGQLSTLVLDKTGTMTQSGMELSMVLPIYETGAFGREVDASMLTRRLIDDRGKQLLRALASCNSVVFAKDGEMKGSPIETEMVRCTGWVSEPDSEKGSFRTEEGEEVVHTIRKCEFDCERQTSSVVVRLESTGQVFAIVKGPCEHMRRLATHSTVPCDFEAICDSYSRDCYYALAIGWKELPVIDEFYCPFLASMPRDELESSLSLGGLLLFRNEIRDESPEVIKHIQAGGVQCVMCTGDHVLAGVHVARRCNLFSEGVRILIGRLADSRRAVNWLDLEGFHCEGPTSLGFSSTELALTCEAFRFLLKKERSFLEDILPLVRVFGYMKAGDKVELVKLWQGHHGKTVVTGYVGDGINDCCALQAADVGIALSLNESAIVASFTRKHPGSLHIVLDILREGRACLANNVSAYTLYSTCCLVSVSSEIVLTIWLGSVFSEWQHVVTDFCLNAVMIWCIVGCRPCQELISSHLDSSLLGARAIASAVAGFCTYWLAAVGLLCILLYGPGTEFVELVHTKYLEVSEIEWSKKSDNYIAAVFFLLFCFTPPSMSLVLSRSDGFREPVHKNVRLVLLSFFFIISALCLLWTSPNALSCIFRTNCDNPTSRDMRLPLTQVGSMGECFFGPQLVKCRNSSGICWMAPPRDARLPLSFVEGYEARTVVPFETQEEKLEFCKRHAYQPGIWSDVGNIWCFFPEKTADGNSASGNNCEPDPIRPPEIDDATGCRGPNNCFSFAFKCQATVLFTIYLCNLCFVFNSAALEKLTQLFSSSVAASVKKMAPQEIEMANLLSEKIT